MEQNVLKDRLDKAIDRLRFDKIVSSQKDFGDKIGYNKSYVSEIFNGKKPITESLIAILVSKFGISEQWLTKGEGEMFKTKETRTDKDSQGDSNMLNEDPANYGISQAAPTMKMLADLIASNLSGTEAVRIGAEALKVMADSNAELVKMVKGQQGTTVSAVQRTTPALAATPEELQEAVLKALMMLGYDSQEARSAKAHRASLAKNG